MGCLGDCGACLLGTAVIGAFLWWIYFYLFLEDFCLTISNPYMAMDFETWGNWNGGITLIGPLVMVIYSVCGSICNRQPTRDDHYAYYPSSDQISYADAITNRKTEACMTCWMVVYPLFELAWTIVGSVLFFGYYIDHMGSGCKTSKAANIVALSFGYFFLLVVVAGIVYLVKNAKK